MWYSALEAPGLKGVPSGRALSATEATIVRGRLALLYRLDEHAMLLDSNEPYGPREPAPLVHVCLGRGSVVSGLRSGLPAEVATGLRVALDALSPLSCLADRSAEDRIWASVRAVPMVAAMRSGPVYRFPETVPPSPNAVLVDRSNSELLLATDPGLVGALPSARARVGHLGRIDRPPDRATFTRTGVVSAGLTAL